jgi:hypothetical protein
MAEREGFEPSVQVLARTTVQQLSALLRCPAIPRTYSRTHASKLTRSHLIRHFRDTTRDSENAFEKFWRLRLVAKNHSLQKLGAVPQIAAPDDTSALGEFRAVKHLQREKHVAIVGQDCTSRRWPSTFVHSQAAGCLLESIPESCDIDRSIHFHANADRHYAWPGNRRHCLRCR